MFRKIREALRLYNYLQEVHSYITILHRKGQYGAVMFEKELVEGRIVEKLHQGSWSKSVTGAVLSVTNIRNNRKEKN